MSHMTIRTARLQLLAALLIAAPTVLPSAARADTVMITGANSGIGLEFAKEYAAQGWTVIATHRRAEPPKSLTDLAAKYRKVRIESLDVTNLEQAQKLAAKLAAVPIDVLINNAGVYNDRAKCAAEDEGCLGDWSVESFGNLKYPLLDTIMAVNIKGPLIVSETFYKNVLASGQKKIIAISSSNGSLSGEASPRPGAIFYRLSKAALNREMQLVAAQIKKDGVTVVMFNPGPTLTEHQASLVKYPEMLTTAFTVQNMIRTIGKVTIADTGRFLRYDGVTEPW
ncbi:MAG TPA: SDR family NAD(P)-dependent oxidoreductase [Steroidobacteraceae bacterium]|jgi:NAD(P)-dependent dehydrogenase (short-subunit alcohol dehydrogenase family)|nr:SDR family NAD(P)-dependent oxidoreductase [Steroidobacteraceae bacterium]